MRSALQKSLYVFICLSLMIILVGIQPAYAASITVTSAADTVANDGVCTLREAITSANSDTVSGAAVGECIAGSGADTISFAADYTIITGSQLPVVNTSITINGNSATNSIIQGAAASQTGTHRIFEVSITGILTLNGVTVANGGCGGSCSTNGTDGGGIYNAGTLTITNGIISGHRANSGAGIKNTGTLSVANTSFMDNHSNNGVGGGIDSRGATTTTVISSTFSSNFATEGGSGIFNYNGGTLTITNSTFTGNSATDNTIQNGTTGAASVMTIINSTIAANSGTNGIQNTTGAILNMSNTIVAGNTGSADCYNSGTIGTNVNNLIQTNASGINACGTPILTSSPNLGSLANNGGNTQTMALLSGSPAIDAGDDTTCADAPVNNTSQNGVTRPQGSHCDIGAFEFESLPLTATFISNATQDGQILETTETSGKGGTIDSSAIRINLGDDAANKQYRAILSFDTSSLPDNAVITSVTLKVKYAGKVGTLPFSTHGNLMADIRKGSFSNNAALQANDFKAAASKNNVLSFTNSMVSNWFSQSLAPANFQYVNLTNVTQFRLRFQTDDNHDFGADLLKIFSSNAGASGRPKLIIEYSVP